VNVVAVGGGESVHPVFWHEDVKTAKSLASMLVDAMGMASCVETSER
jgi:hypothetical protein